MRKPKLLIITQQRVLPILNGATLRIYNLAVNLLEWWDIDIVCLKPLDKQGEEKLRDTFNEVFFASTQETRNQKRNGWAENILKILVPSRTTYSIPFPYNDQMYSLVRKAVRKQVYDSILAFEAPVFVFYLSDLELKNISCDVIDSMCLHLWSMMKKTNIPNWEIFSLFLSCIYESRWEKKYLSKATKLITITERDKRWLKRSVRRERIYVVENGVDTDYFKPWNDCKAQDEQIVVFTGVMSYEPNHDAMVYCLREIWPQVRRNLPEARLRIIGKDPRKSLYDIAKKVEGVDVIGEVPDMREALKGAKVFLCPMRIGSGMKNKILEAFSMGIPVVTTKEGRTGINFVHGKVGYEANSPEKLASYTVDLLTSENLLRSFSNSCRKIAVREYSWKSKAKNLSLVLVLRFI